MNKFNVLDSGLIVNKISKSLGSKPIVRDLSLNIKKGEILQEGVNIEVLRPGNKTRGLDPRLINEVSGKKAKNDISLGEGITEYE